MLALVAACVLLAADTPPPPAEARSDYEAARLAAGRSPDDQVKLALWCEARGLTAERLKHLAMAVMADPGHAAARGLMGLVSRDGRWQRPEAVADALKADPARVALLAEYDGRRSKTPYTADAQLALGLWCEERGLAEQSRAHLTATTRIDPSREVAWRHLWYKKHEGRWITDAQLAADRAEAEAQKQADRHWKPLLEKYRAALKDKDQAKRAAAEAALTDVTDPRAVRSVWSVFAPGGEANQAMAVRLLGQIPGVPASRALADLAVRGATPEVRRVATETLKNRDLREFIGLLTGLVRKPLEYRVVPINGPGSPGVLFVQGERYNIRRTYVAPIPPVAAGLPRLFNADVPFDPAAWQANSLGANLLAASAGVGPGFDPNRGGANSDPAGNLIRNATVAAARRDARIGQAMMYNQALTMTLQNQLAADVQAVETTNVTIRATNDRLLPVLKDITGKEYGDDPDAWQRWQLDQKGYALRESTGEKPTFDQVVSIRGTQSGHACFGAGTPVRTIDGVRPIESIRAGDLVIVQDTRAGSLGFQPVVAVFHNPPNATFRVTLGDDAIVATGIHRFWRAGKGWTMARDLKAGDLIRTVGGVVAVGAVEGDRTQPVFNLEVAEGHSFFVGRSGALVHDNSLVEATPEPFDAPPASKPVAAAR